MTALPLTTKRGLRSEARAFLVDRAGIVTDRFEAVVSMDKLTGALTPLLDTGNTDRGSGFGY